MENFFTRYRNETLLFAILFAQIIALAVQIRVPGSNVAQGQAAPRLIRVWATALISPFQKLTMHTGAGARGLWKDYVDLVHVRRENQQMQQEIDRLRLQQASLEQDAEQGHRVQALLGFREQFIDKTLAAQVIGTSGTDLSRVIYVDRGTHDGVQAGMAVITPDGIVGKISRADRSTSQVLLISDPLSGAGVLLERLRLNGILKGTQSGQPEIIDVMADEKIMPGDKVITTGGDRVFPKGLPVGVVTQVSPDPERDPFLSIHVKPAVNLGRLEEVLIVTKLGERDVTTASDTTPIRAADMLAERLPSAKKKPDAADATAKTSPGEVGTPIASATKKPVTATKPTAAVEKPKDNKPTKPVKEVPR